MDSATYTRLQRDLFRTTAVASTCGAGVFLVFAFTAFTLTSAHLLALVVPAGLVIALSGVGQWIYHNSLLKPVGAYCQDPATTPPLDALSAMADFPLKAARISLGLWVFAALALAIVMSLKGALYTNTMVLVGFFGIALSGTAACIFQYYFYKRTLYPVALEITADRKGATFVSSSTFLGMRRKLVFTIVGLMTIGMVFIALLGVFLATRVLEDQALENFAATAHATTDRLAPILWEPNADLLKAQLLEGAAGLSQGRMVIVDAAGDLIAGEFSDLFPESAFQEAWERRGEFQTARVSEHYQVQLLALTDHTGRVAMLGGPGGIAFLQRIEESQFTGALSRLNWGIVIFLIIAWVGGTYIAILAASDVSRPISNLVDVTGRIGAGDLTADVTILTDDEMGSIGAGLTAMTTGLRELIERVTTASHHVEQATQDIATRARVLTAGYADQVASIDATNAAAQEISDASKEVADHVAALVSTATQSSAATTDIGTLMDEVAENVTELGSSVEAASSALQEMTASIRQVTSSVGDLNASAEETASSMMEMDTSIAQVGERAQETLNLSKEMLDSAQRGVAVVQDTIQGIGKIDEAVRDATRVITELSVSAGKIGKIITVINEVADQTNLFALNAAIIAAQAGEHGKGFAVVADEIKNLAERTTHSTKEIFDLIKRVQTESRRAAETMEEGVKSVEEGVNLSHQAGQALEQIMKSAEKSTEMVRGIAKATEEQTTSSRRITQAAEAIAERVDQIATATMQQERGSEQALEAASEMREIAPVVRMKAQKQLEGREQITHALQRIQEMVNFINRAQAHQAQESEKLLTAIGQIAGLSRTGTDHVAQLEAALTVLEKESETLSSQVQRFTLNAAHAAAEG